MALSAIFLLFVDRFKRSVRFCHTEFVKEAISDGSRSENAQNQWRVLIF